MQDVHDGKAGVEPDEIGQLQRSHRVVGAQPHCLVDGFHVAHAFIQHVDRFVYHRHQDAVDDEGRKIFGRGGGLTQTFDHGHAGVERFLVGCDTADQFDQAHHRNGVHEVEPQEFLGTVGLRRQPSDRDRRGIRCQDGLGLQGGDKLLEDRVLHGLALGRGLNHQVALAQIGQRAGGCDAGHGGIALLLGNLLARDLPVQVLADLVGSAVQRLGVDIGQNHVVPGQGADMGDAVAHLTGADHAHAFDIHPVIPCLARADDRGRLRSGQGPRNRFNLRL